MTTRRDDVEIFIQISGVGFEFLVDKRMKHNLINPSLLAFFKLYKNKEYSPSNNIGEVNTKPEYNNNMDPFNPDYIDYFITKDVIHYVGKKLGRCRDNKLRICKVFMLEFKYEGCLFTFPFLLDKSLDIPAILGFVSYNKLIKTVMEQNKKT